MVERRTPIRESRLIRYFGTPVELSIVRQRNHANRVAFDSTSDIRARFPDRLFGARKDFLAPAAALALCGAGQPGDPEQIPPRLEQPQRNDVSGSSNDAGRAELRNTNAPPLAGIDLGRSSAALPRK
jgi:hypothetical protein